MSSNDCDVEISVGPLTLKDVYHYVLKEERKPRSRSQSLNFTPHAISAFHGSEESAAESSTSDAYEIYTADEGSNHSSPNRSNGYQVAHKFKGSVESAARSSSSDVCEIYTAEEGSNHSSPDRSNGYKAAYKCKEGKEAAEDDLIRFDSYLAPSTSYKQIATDVEGNSNESALGDIELRSNSSLHIKAEKDDTVYFTCNESLQSKAMVNESVITISDEEEEQSIEEGNWQPEIGNESVESDSIVILSDDDEIVNESPQDASRTSFEENLKKEDCDLLDSTFETIERILNLGISEDSPTTEAEIGNVIVQETPERQCLTPQKITSRTNNNRPNAQFKSGIPISTAKLVSKQATNERDLFKIPMTPVNKCKKRNLNPVSPVAMYIKYSPQPLPLRHVTGPTKAQNPTKTGPFIYKDVELPKVFYKPSSLQVSNNEETMKLPTSYCKLILNPIVYKHEKTMRPVMDSETISTILDELEKNAYNKLDESSVNVSIWTTKGAYEETQYQG